MNEEENDSVRAPGAEGEGAMSEDEIDANLEDTFPASDPPAWTLGSDHRPAGEERDDEAE